MPVRTADKLSHPATHPKTPDARDPAIRRPRRRPRHTRECKKHRTRPMEENHPAPCPRVSWKSTFGCDPRPPDPFPAMRRAPGSTETVAARLLHLNARSIADHTRRLKTLLVANAKAPAQSSRRSPHWRRTVFNNRGVRHPRTRPPYSPVPHRSSASLGEVSFARNPANHPAGILCFSSRGARSSEDQDPRDRDPSERFSVRQFVSILGVPEAE